MPTFTKFYQYEIDDTAGKHDWSSHTFKLMLSNTAPDATANAVKADITEISAGNGYSAGGATLTITRSAALGVEQITVSADITFTAAGGSIGPFQYGIVYNNTQTSPSKPLVGYVTAAAAITLADTETCTFDFDQVNGLFIQG